jgi:hypothetical protein
LIGDAARLADASSRALAFAAQHRGAAGRMAEAIAGDIERHPGEGRDPGC